MSSLPYSYPESASVSVNFKKRKSRFTFPEVQLLLTEVKKNRHILVGKFNQGISGDMKKRTWASLSARINEISECHRETIEIVKKWSDLKCDTKRKVAAMRASGLSAARIAMDLSPVERMVQQILTPGPGEKSPHISNSIPDEDEDSQAVPGVTSHVPGTANGSMPIQPKGVSVYSGVSIEGGLDTPIDYDSVVPLTDLQFEPSGREDQGKQSGGSLTFPDPARDDPEQIETETQHKASSTGAENSFRTSVIHQPTTGPGSLQEHLSKSACLSLQEQQATTLLIGALSRSLESMADSVQHLVQTQQQFARDTLRLQRDTLHVLRDFSSSALALLQDKTNGHP